jgi:hypothetical protein
MITGFEDFCLYVYVIVDDLCQQVAPLLRRPGPMPQCSDSELLALCLIGKCKGWDLETDLLSNLHAYQALFPHLPEQSRFNRRRRRLMWVKNVLRRLLLSRLDVAQDSQCIIDKGYVSAQQAADLLAQNRIRLHTLPHRNQKHQLPSNVKQLFNAARQLIETVNGQLTEQFNIETNHAGYPLGAFWGLCARLYTKLTAHTLCIYINRLWASPTSYRSKLWLSLSSIRPY